MSASSCVHGARLETSCLFVQSTSTWRVLVVRTCLVVSMPATLISRKENNSVLFSSMQRNACQFPGTALDDSTHLLTPFPLLLRASAFKLSGTHLSQTMSNLVKVRCDVRQENISGIIMEGLGSTRSQHIDDSSTIKDIVHVTCTVTLSFTGIRSCKHFNKSDFVPLLKTPICESAGGQARFLCLKNSSRSPSRTWEAMYNREKSEQLFFNGSCLPDFSLGRLKRGRLLRLIGSVIGFV